MSPGLVVDIEHPVNPPSVMKKLDSGYLKSQTGLPNACPSACLDFSDTSGGMYLLYVSSSSASFK